MATVSAAEAQDEADYTYSSALLRNMVRMVVNRLRGTVNQVGHLLPDSGEEEAGDHGQHDEGNDYWLRFR